MQLSKVIFLCISLVCSRASDFENKFSNLQKGLKEVKLGIKERMLKIHEQINELDQAILECQRNSDYFPSATMSEPEWSKIAIFKLSTYGKKLSLGFCGLEDLKRKWKDLAQSAMETDSLKSYEQHLKKKEHLIPRYNMFSVSEERIVFQNIFTGIPHILQQFPDYFPLAVRRNEQYYYFKGKNVEGFEFISLPSPIVVLHRSNGMAIFNNNYQFEEAYSYSVDGSMHSVKIPLEKIRVVWVPIEKVKEIVRRVEESLN